MTEQSFSGAEATRSLNVCENHNRRWWQKFGREAAEVQLNATEREELERLRRDIDQLCMKGVIFINASGSPAKEMK